MTSTGERRAEQMGDKYRAGSHYSQAIKHCEGVEKFVKLQLAIPLMNWHSTSQRA